MDVLVISMDNEPEAATGFKRTMNHEAATEL